LIVDLLIIDLSIFDLLIIDLSIFDLLSSGALIGRRKQEAKW